MRVCAYVVVSRVDVASCCMNKRFSINTKKQPFLLIFLFWANEQVDVSRWKERLRAGNEYYYSFKIFSRFWLVKITRLIHHNRLLLTKSEKKSFVILNRWHEKCSPLQINERRRQNDVKSAAHCRLLNRLPRKLGKLGYEIVLFLVSRKTKSQMAKLVQEGEIFWMNNEFGFGG